MKKHLYPACGLLIIALACASFSGCETSSTASSTSAATAAAPNMDGGQLVIFRAANLGETLFVTIDGVKKGQVRQGDTFKGALSPGQHVVSVILMPNELNLPPTVKKLTVEKGKTYAFTAMWEGDTLVLRH